MKEKIRSGLRIRIRTAAVRNSDIGYILACDPEMDEDEILHTNVFRWESGRFEESFSNFSAHTCCVASVPDSAFIQLAGFGEYGISTANGIFGGNVFDGQPKDAKQGAFQIVTAIAGKAHAAGLGGIVYRLDGFVKWTPMDKGLSSSLNFWAIDGFDGEDIYAAGDDGALWHFDGRKWSYCDPPTNMNFNTLKCAGNGKVYVAGNDGQLLCGRANTWQFIAEDETGDTFWDLKWFEGNLYLSTRSFVYRLKDGGLELVDFGDDTPETCYHLSTAKGVLWSIGAKDIMNFDGKRWTRVV